MASNLESMRRFLAEGNAPPIARLIGFRATAVGDGTATFELDTDPDKHANPMGTVHGGVLCDLADAAMGYSWASTLEDGESFTSIDLQIHFFKPVWRARLRAVGKVIKRGRTVGYVECDVTNEKGELVARAQSTCMTLRGEQAKGR